MQTFRAMDMQRFPTEKQRWSDLIETYFNSDRRIGLVFQLVDMRHSPTKDDLMMINFLIENELPFVIILTKKDKLSKNSRMNACRRCRARSRLLTKST